MEAPVKGDYNTSKTYYLDPLKFTSRKFTSIKDKLRVSRVVSNLYVMNKASSVGTNADKLLLYRDESLLGVMYHSLSLTSKLLSFF